MTKCEVCKKSNQDGVFICTFIGIVCFGFLLQGITADSFVNYKVQENIQVTLPDGSLTTVETWKSYPCTQAQVVQNFSLYWVAIILIALTMAIVYFG